MSLILEALKKLDREKGWKMVLDKKRGGYRKVVPSPKPIGIVDSKPVRRLIFGGRDQSEVVIACGGGGIPVVFKDDRYFGVEAVVDKDLAAAMLGNNIKESLFVIATDVEHVFADFGALLHQRPVFGPLAPTFGGRADRGFRPGERAQGLHCGLTHHGSTPLRLVRHRLGVLGSGCRVLGSGCRVLG